MKMRKWIHYKNGKALQDCADSNGKGFTLTELMIVVVLIGVIAAFAIPEYGKSVRKSQERNTIMELLSLHSANQVYEARSGDFLTGTNLNLTQINTGLSINLSGLDVAYDYDFKAGKKGGAGRYKATATGTGGNTFSIRVDEDPLVLRGAGKGVRNPCCSGKASCPSLPDC